MKLRFPSTRYMYIRIFLLLGTLFTVLLIINATFLTSKISENAVREISKLTKSQLNQAENNTQFMLQRMRMEALNLYSNNYVHAWLYFTKGTEDTTTLALAADQVRNALITDPFIHGVYLINFAKQQVYTTESGLYDFKSFYDQDILDVLQNRRPRFMKFFDHNIKDNSYLTLIAETTPTEKLANGYLVILLDKKLLADHMLQISSDYESSMVMMDTQDRILLGNVDPIVARQLPDLQLDQKAQPYFWRVNEGEMVVHYTELESEGFKLYHLTPLTTWNKNVAQMRWTIIGSTIVLLFVLLIVVYWNSRKNYKPFGDLARHTLELVRNRSVKADLPEMADNDARLLEWGLKSLSDKVDDLSQFVNNNRILVKEDYLRQWLLSSRLNPLIRSHLTSESSILEYAMIRIAVIRINAFGAFSKRYDFSSRKLLKYAMGNIAQEVLLDGSMYGETLDMGSDHMVILIGSEEAKSGTTVGGGLYDVLTRIRREIANYLHVATTISVSRPHSIEESLQNLYRDTYELTLLRFLHTEDRVFEERDGEEMASRNTSYTGKAQIEAVVQAIKMKDKRSMSAALEQFLEPLGRLSISECRLLLSQLIYSVLKAFRRWDASRDLETSHSLPDMFETLGEARTWLEGQFSTIIDELAETPTGSRKEEAAAEMVEYIRNHFQRPNLTVEEIAEHVSMSVGYIYQIFKMVLDTTVADYILRQRIEHVQKLLVTTEWPIQDIAEQSGFQTKSHFFTAFKKLTGMTPNQYRHEKRGEAPETTN